MTACSKFMHSWVRRYCTLNYCCYRDAVLVIYVHMTKVRYWCGADYIIVVSCTVMQLSIIILSSLCDDVDHVEIMVYTYIHTCWKLLSNQVHLVFKRFIELVVEQSPRVLTLQSTTIQLGG